MGAGDRAYWDDIQTMLEAPVGKLVAQATQNFADNTATAWTFGAGSESLDEGNFHDTATNPSRITPNIPGVYFFIATAMPGARSDWSDLNTGWRKNGASSLAPWTRNTPPLISGIQSQVAWALEKLNGSTDYMELMGQYNNAANVTQASNQSGQYTAGVAWFLVGGERT